ncbi:hypothetical protein JJB11_21690 [Ramlibacter ginsenosidimutans]|uniref:Tetratricopeptide repeat protein n=1 Tax=Ramlibacter ginsenosidimutans TaxID=502333 RepID=A0A934WPV2_9BURK|nr:tetratricopeptide repeat protein [Ramlibacter ginsenosidimutans]MBK6008720.1 hypothetical protein [Ramlibacter ginsenosidimutans]
MFLSLLLALVAFAVHAQPAHEPTVDEIYQAAEHGDLVGARSMVDQVLAKHPNSAKAHYVKAEVAARQHEAALARGELQAAETLAPGLPFARPDAVSALRAQLGRPSRHAVTPVPDDALRQPAHAGRSGFPVGGFVALVLIFIVAMTFVRSRLSAAAAPTASVYPPQRPDEAFGRYDAPHAGYPSGAYQPGAYPPGAYSATPAPSLGSTLGHGLATGLAVGAGVVAAEEIGHRIFDHQGGALHAPAAAPGAWGENSPLARDAGIDALRGGADPNPDMGGRDFGIADHGGWEDAGGGDFGVENGSDDWNT